MFVVKVKDQGIMSATPIDTPEENGTQTFRLLELMKTAQSEEEKFVLDV
jgi:hypothetical protein